MVLTLSVLVVAAVAWSAWSVWRVQGDLRAAEDAYDDLVTALGDDDREARDAALATMRDEAASAKGRTDGPWWGLMTHTPGIGDDLGGVEALVASLDVVAADGLGPLLEAIDQVDGQGLAADGRVDLDLLASLRDPVDTARQAFQDAGRALDGHDSSGYIGLLQDPFDDQVDRVGAAEHALTTATTATEVLPRMLGSEGPRDYLLVVQNNAEIRATGGLPGSWSRVHAEDGNLSIEEQGASDDFPLRDSGKPFLRADELALYGPVMGRFFQNAGFTPDFPRAAELLAGHFAEIHPEIDLDGVVSIDPVTLSYLLEGTGNIDVNGIELRPGNVVEVLLSDVYKRLQPDEQDAAFELVTKRMFEAVTTTVPDPFALVLGLGQAADQGRFLIAPFDEADAADLEGSSVIGSLTGDEGRTPHVDVGLNDATGAKMSYYQRQSADVSATGCTEGRQQLTGTLTLSQDIDPAEAAELPDTISGGSRYGIGVGSQAVVARLYAPYAGSVDSVTVAGVVQPVETIDIDGRPVATVTVVLTGRAPVQVQWTMTTGPGQTGDGELDVTPGVERGTSDAEFASAC